MVDLRGATRAAEALKYNRVLKTLCIQGCQVTNVGATALAEMLLHNQALTNLDYSDNPIGSAGLNALHDSWNKSRSIEKHRMAVTGGRFSIQTASPDLSEHAHQSITSPTAEAKSTPAATQFQWAKEQLLANQAKSKQRRR